MFIFLFFFQFFHVFVLSKLCFKSDGTFKVLLIADLHFNPICEDIPTELEKYICNGYNSTRYAERVIDAENPDLIIFVGDTVDEGTIDGKVGMNHAFGIAFNREKPIPWAAVLGNHDQQVLFMGREKVMEYIVSMPHTLSEMGDETIKGYGNYKLQVFHEESPKFDLFMLDSLDFHKFPFVPGEYDWIHSSQVHWVAQNVDQHNVIPAAAFFHIPIPEFDTLVKEGVKIVGDKFDGVSASKLNSGIFAEFVTSGAVKAVFVGHNHKNDYCGKWCNIQLCFCGAAGYGSYGKADWPRRIRVLELRMYGDEIVTWKRLYDDQLTKKDEQVLWFA